MTEATPPPDATQATGEVRPVSIGVWGHYYGSNLGDELVTATILSAVRERLPDARVHAFSLDAEDTRRRHQVDAHPITSGRPRLVRRGGSAPMRLAYGLLRRADSLLREPQHWWSSWRALRGIDQLVVAGSGQLLDQWNGPWGHPFTVFKWALLARLAKTRLVMPSVGAGPIKGGLARYFIRLAVNSAAYVSVRDEGTAEVLRSIGVRRQLPVVPDMAFGLRTDALGAPRVRTPGGRPVIGVNPMAHANAHYWGRGDPGRYRAYIDKVATLCAGIIQDGGDVVLFSSQTVGDPPAARDVLAAIRVPEVAARVRTCAIDDHVELVNLIQSCDAVIAARYHCVLLPLRFGIPTIALAYHPKTEHLMRMAGQQERCLDIDTFDDQDLLGRYRTMIERDASIRSELAQRVPPLRSAVLDQFDAMFGRSSIDSS